MIKTLFVLFFVVGYFPPKAEVKYFTDLNSAVESYQKLGPIDQMACGPFDIFAKRLFKITWDLKKVCVVTGTVDNQYKWVGVRSAKNSCESTPSYDRHVEFWDYDVAPTVVELFVIKSSTYTIIESTETIK